MEKNTPLYFQTKPKPVDQDQVESFLHHGKSFPGQVKTKRENHSEGGSSGYKDLKHPLWHPVAFFFFFGSDFGEANFAPPGKALERCKLTFWYNAIISTRKYFRSFVRRNHSSFERLCIITFYLDANSRGVWKSLLNG